MPIATRLTATRLTLSLTLCAGLLGGAHAALADPAAPPAAGGATTAPAAPATSKKPTRAELGAMLKKCSEEADAKGLTPQNGKSEQRKAYRRACMLKNGVAPKR